MPKRRRNTKNDENAPKKERDTTEKVKWKLPLYDWPRGPPSLSIVMRGENLALSEDRQTVYGWLGWSTILATQGHEKGKWYYEVEVLPSVMLPPGNEPAYTCWPYIQEPHIRVGWSCRYADFGNALGFAPHSVGVRDVDGSCVSGADRTPFLGVPFGPGDLMRCWINLPRPVYKTQKENAEIWHELWNNMGMMCDPKSPPPVNRSEGSFATFELVKKNGTRVLKECMHDMLAEGTWYPAISLFMGASAKINLGVTEPFRFPPSPESGYLPAGQMRKAKPIPRFQRLLDAIARVRKREKGVGVWAGVPGYEDIDPDIWDYDSDDYEEDPMKYYIPDSVLMLEKVVQAMQVKKEDREPGGKMWKSVEGVMIGEGDDAVSVPPPPFKEIEVMLYRTKEQRLNKEPNPRIKVHIFDEVRVKDENKRIQQAIAAEKRKRILAMYGGARYHSTRR